MIKMKNMKTDDEYYEYFKKTRNIQDSTLRTYHIAIQEYCQYHQLTLHELLTEAETEEEQGIRWKHRTLKKRLLEYRAYLYQTHAKSTARTRFIRVKAFYHHFDIEIHRLPPITDNTPIKRNKPSDLPSKKELRQTLKICKPVMRPLILFMTSSGCAKKETLSLTIQDYINATEKYHNGGTIKEIIETLEETSDVVPVWEILRHKTHKYYTTFNTPEATHEINLYLKQRKDHLTPESRLFRINETYLVDTFTRLNKALNLGKSGTYNKLRSHTLRKWHASTLMNDGMSRELVNDLQGKNKNITDTAYFYNDETHLLQEYSKHIPALTIMADVEKITIKSKEFLELENKNQELEGSIRDMWHRIESLENITWEDVRKEY